MNNIERYAERFKELSFKDKKRIVDEVNYNENIFEDFKVSDDWNDFLYGIEPRDVIRMAVNGDVNPRDDYIRYSSDGNLESLTEWELEDEIDYHSDEIITELIERMDEIEDESNFRLFALIFTGHEGEEENE